VGKGLSDRLNDLFGRSIRLDERDGGLVGLGWNEGGKLTVQQTGGEEVVLSGGKPLDEFLAIDLKDQNLDPRINGENLAIFRLEGGAGDDRRGICFKSLPQEIGERIQPGNAVRIGERFSPGHLLFVGRGMVIVTVMKFSAKEFGQAAADHAFT